ncbi:DUF2510 domain-containing protein [Rhodococcus hoagii]|nr:DUF2510 domain-containing protein [Prescottella equi]NKS12612.1 DUF2510 domain-containing protein [Prescottella equi]
MAADTTPAGWHPDPSDALKLRYWNGSDWTADTRPRPPGGTATATSEATGSAGARSGFAMLQWVFAILAGISVVVVIVMFYMGVDAGYTKCGTLVDRQDDSLKCVEALNSRSNQAGVAVVVMLALIALTVVAFVQGRRLKNS